MKQTFEDFLMEKHAEDYIGVKDFIVDDCADWMGNLSVDEFIEYGDQFAKEQSKDLLEALRNIIEIGKRDMSNPKYNTYFKEAKQAIAKAEGGEK